MVGELRIKGVTKRFPREKEEDLIALDGVNLEIEAGSFVSLIGPSGCGKSTLLRLIAGLEAANEGEILLDGEKISGTSYERGLVFQDPALFPWLNIHDNVAFGLKARHIYGQNKALVQEYIHLVGLGGFEKSYPHQLSGGMCQRAALARTLVGKPKILLLDEPLGALDAFTRMNMQDEILRIQKEESMTMIMVTHDVDEAIYLSDRVVVMSPRPAKIEEVIDIELGAKPRARSNQDFLKYRSKILRMLHYGGDEKEVDYYI